MALLFHLFTIGFSLLQEARNVPKLCYAIEEKLSDSFSDEKLKCFVSLEEFYKWVAHDVQVILTEDERKISVEFLDSSGIVSADLLV